MSPNRPRRALSAGPAAPAGGRAALAVASFAVLLAGCSGRSDLLARVDGHDITIQEFTEVASRAAQQYPGPPDSARTKLLNDLVQRQLLLAGARGAKIEEQADVQAFRARSEQQILSEALFQKLVGGPFPVSDAEIQAMYDRRATETHVRFIFSYTPDIARRALAELQRGGDFAALADRYNPAGMMPPGGDVGWVQAGALMPPLDDSIQAGALQRPIGPIEAPNEGWLVARLEGRRPAQRGSFEQEKVQLGEMMRQRKQRLTLLRELNRMRAEHEVKVEPGAAQVMVGAFKPADPAQSAPAPSPEARKQVLARFRGGQFTLGDAYDDLMSGSGRPNLDMLPTVERWIEGQTLARVAIVEAKQRHLDEEPAVKQKLRDRVDGYLLEIYYQREVNAMVQVTPDDLAQAFQRYQSSFVQTKSARVQSVVVRDSAQAAALAQHAGQVSSLREAAATAAAGARVRDEKLVFAKLPPAWALYAGHLASLPPGQFAGPFPTAGGWLIFQVVEKQQSAPSLDSLSAAARGQLQMVAGEAKREQRLTALTDSLRRVVHPVDVHPDRLRRVPWPPPAAPPGS